MVSQWSGGEDPKPIPVDRCVAIERATGGAVRRWDLRPGDWHEHWPELIGMEGAPPVNANSVFAFAANAQRVEA